MSIECERSAIIATEAFDRGPGLPLPEFTGVWAVFARWVLHRPAAIGTSYAFASARIDPMAIDRAGRSNSKWSCQK